MSNTFQGLIGWALQYSRLSDCDTILIYKNTVLTEEQIKANHYFFLIGYNIDADPVA